MRVLVTGGAGYIGGVVVQELIRSGHKVVAYDDLSNGYRAAVSAEAEFVEGDIADAEKLTRILERFSIEAVMHLAASIEAGESMKTPVKYFRNNSANTLTLLETMLRQGIKRLVFSSTAALYGNPENIPIREEDPLRPTNVYGESKLLVEQMLAWLHKIHGLRYASLRYFNASGAAGALGEAHKPESHLIPLILQVASGNRESISIFGTDYPTPDGSCIRDYVHVLDLASAHLLALDALGSRDKLIYNLGNGKGFSVREVITMAREVTGHAIRAVESPRRPGDPAILVASSEKIQKELHWRPQYQDIRKIIASAWEWHQSHPDGYSAAAERKPSPCPS